MIRKFSALSALCALVLSTLYAPAAFASPRGLVPGPFHDNAADSSGQNPDNTQGGPAGAGDGGSGGVNGPDTSIGASTGKPIPRVLVTDFTTTPSPVKAGLL